MATCLFWHGTCIGANDMHFVLNRILDMVRTCWSTLSILDSRLLPENLLVYYVYTVFPMLCDSGSSLNLGNSCFSFFCGFPTSRRETYTAFPLVEGVIILVKSVVANAYTHILNITILAERMATAPYTSNPLYFVARTYSTI